MLDQVEALKWVKDNNANFGGNLNKVTIFGQSAGATSVSLQLLTPLSNGLFHQAIAESGVDLIPFGNQPISEGLAQKLDCRTKGRYVFNWGEWAGVFKKFSVKKVVALPLPRMD